MLFNFSQRWPKVCYRVLERNAKKNLWENFKHHWGSFCVFKWECKLAIIVKLVGFFCTLLQHLQTSITVHHALRVKDTVFTWKTVYPCKQKLINNDFAHASTYIPDPDNTDRWIIYFWMAYKRSRYAKLFSRLQGNKLEWQCATLCFWCVG